MAKRSAKKRFMSRKRKNARNLRPNPPRLHALHSAVPPALAPDDSTAHGALMGLARVLGIAHAAVSAPALELVLERVAAQVPGTARVPVSVTALAAVSGMVLAPDSEIAPAAALGMLPAPDLVTVRAAASAMVLDDLMARPAPQARVPDPDLVIVLAAALGMDHALDLEIAPAARRVQAPVASTALDLALERVALGLVTVRAAANLLPAPARVPSQASGPSSTRIAPANNPVR